MSHSLIFTMVQYHSTRGASFTCSTKQTTSRPSRNLQVYLGGFFTRWNSFPHKRPGILKNRTPLLLFITPLHGAFNNKTSGLPFMLGNTLGALHSPQISTRVPKSLSGHLIWECPALPCPRPFGHYRMYTPSTFVELVQTYVTLCNGIP